MDKKVIGKRLRALRGGRTIEETARMLGVSKSAVAMYESGERIPRDAVKIKYAKLFGVSVESIFFDERVHSECSGD